MVASYVSTIPKETVVTFTSLQMFVSGIVSWKPVVGVGWWLPMPIPYLICINFVPYFRHIVFSLILLVLLDTKIWLTSSTYTAFSLWFWLWHTVKIENFAWFLQAMWLMLQQDSPDDFVIATGETHSVREFVEAAFNYIGKDIVWKGEGENEVGQEKDTGIIRVKVNPKYFRPTEVVRFFLSFFVIVMKCSLFCRYSL